MEALLDPVAFMLPSAGAPHLRGGQAAASGSTRATSSQAAGELSVNQGLAGSPAAATVSFVLAVGWLVGRRHPRRSVVGSSRTARGAVVFIDGEAGTTGLQVRERLEKHPEIDILSLPAEYRKDDAARHAALRSADAAVLCLPDEAARAAVEMVGDADTVIVDASTAFRVSDEWTYGFPELTGGQREAIAASKRISNPGCYATGFISLMRPLVERGMVPPETLLTTSAISGYSGGGKGLIDIYENGPHEPWGTYGLGLNHKHLAEMRQWVGLAEEPIFCPAVADFKQGMVVSVPLRLSQLSPGVTAASLHSTFCDHYAGQRFVSVAPVNSPDALERGAFIRPDTLNNTNKLEIFIFANEEKGTVWLMSRLDNLGKATSGQCVQNLNIALGFDEGTGLEA